MNLESILVIIILVVFLVFFLLLIRWYGEIKRNIARIDEGMKKFVVELDKTHRQKVNKK